MITAQITFTCDICGCTQIHIEDTSEFSEIAISLTEMAEGWGTVWISEDDYDTICDICMDKYSSLIIVKHSNYHWGARPIPIPSEFK